MERNCTLLLHYDKATPPNEEEIRELLESKEPEKKVEAMKTLISLQLNGESMPKMLMVVIRFVVPCDDHKLKKLLLIYWEVIDKCGPDGKLLPEMILVWCAAPTAFTGADGAARARWALRSAGRADAAGICPARSVHAAGGARGART